MSLYLSVAWRTAASDACDSALATPTPPSAKTAASVRARMLIRFFTSHLERNFVDVGRRVAGAFVDAHDGLLRRSRDQAEDLPRHGVQPRLLVMDTLRSLDREVATVGLGELLLADPEEAGVHVHEFRHRYLLCSGVGRHRTVPPRSFRRPRRASVDRPIGPSQSDLICPGSSKLGTLV